MSAIANTIRKLTGRLALLRAERERYQALCAAAYQLAGAVNAPVRFLDAFADGANGEIEARQKTDDLLPVDSMEIGAFPVSSNAEVEGWKRDALRYQWLRDIKARDLVMNEFVVGCPESLDRAIDDEMEGR